MLTNWDGLAPAVAAVSLAVLAFLPDKPDQAGPSSIRDVRQMALESGSPGTAVAWNDRRSGLSGTLVPADVFKDGQDRVCRTYTVAITGGGTSLHSACRLPTGAWQGDDAGTVDRDAERGVVARLFSDEPGPQVAAAPPEDEPQASMRPSAPASTR